jgi:ribonuclease D
MFMTFKLTMAGEELLKELKDLRKKIADEEVVPVYYVFPNDALLDMVVKTPLDEATFLTCEKVGQKGYDRYGEAFIDVIRKFTLLHKGPYYNGEITFTNKRHFLTDEGRRLFEQLSVQRDMIASKYHLAPDLMLTDQTLINFVVLLPYSREEMMRIYGVKKEYRDYYMDPLIQTIYRFTGGFKKRLYHMDVPRPTFSLTKEEATHFKTAETMNATAIAKELNRISSSKIRLSATDITSRVKKYDYYQNGFEGEIIISKAGEAFGLTKVKRQNREGKSYEVVLYNKDAQIKIAQWFIAS